MTSVGPDRTPHGPSLSPRVESLAAASLAGATSRLSFANLAFVGLSTLQVVAIGAVFGTSRGYELFLLAWMIPELALFAFGNVLHTHLTPVLVGTARRGRSGLGAATWGLCGGLAAVVAVLAAIAWLLGPILVDLATGPTAGAELTTTIGLFRWLLLAAAGLAAVKVLGLLHRAVHSLSIPAFAQSITPVVIIAVVLLRPDWGVLGLVAAYVGGALLQILVLTPGPIAWGMLRRDPPVSEAAPDGGHGHAPSGMLAGLLASALPLLVITSGFRVAILLDRVEATGLAPGDIAVLRYAFFFVMAVHSLVSMPFITVAFNHLSHLASDARSGAEAIEASVAAVVELLWNILVPIACVLAVVPLDLVQVLLGREAFGPEAVARTASVLAVYAAMLPFVACAMVAEKAFLSRHRYRLLTVTAVAFPLANLALNHLLGARFGIEGVALATSLAVAGWCGTVVVAVLARSDPGSWRGLLRSVAVTSAIAAAVVAAGRTAVGAAPGSGWARLVVVGGGSLLLFAAASWAVQGRRLAGLARGLRTTRIGS